jgi:hypothetical protein
MIARANGVIDSLLCALVYGRLTEVIGQLGDRNATRRRLLFECFADVMMQPSWRERELPAGAGCVGDPRPGGIAVPQRAASARPSLRFLTVTNAQALVRSARAQVG